MSSRPFYTVCGLEFNSSAAGVVMTPMIWAVKTSLADAVSYLSITGCTKYDDDKVEDKDGFIDLYNITKENYKKLRPTTLGIATFYIHRGNGDMNTLMKELLFQTESDDKSSFTRPA